MHEKADPRFPFAAAPLLQVEFAVAFIGATYARLVAAPLNQAYRPVSC